MQRVSLSPSADPPRRGPPADWGDRPWADSAEAGRALRNEPVHRNRGGVKFGAEVFLQDRVQALTALISTNVRLGLEAAPHPLMRGDVFNDALDLLCQTAMAQWAAIEQIAVGPLAPLATPAGLMKVAWGTFQAQLLSWLSTRCKTE
jgi:hypothetical protein